MLPRPSARVLLLAIGFLGVGCSPTDLLEENVNARSPMAWMMWRGDIARRQTQAQQQELDAMIQELSLSVMIKGIATGSDGVDSAVRAEVDGNTLRQLLRKGYEAKWDRLDREQAQLTACLRENARLRTRPDDSASAAYLDRFREQQRTRWKAVVAEMGDANQHLAQLGGSARPLPEPMQVRPALPQGSAEPIPTVVDEDQVDEKPQLLTTNAKIEEPSVDPDAAIDRALQIELLAIFNEDQDGRRKLDALERQGDSDSSEVKALWKEISEKDDANLPKVTAILDRRGWPGPALVGKKANEAVFLVIQHADLATQQKYLPMMRAAVREGKAEAGRLALLEDRVALGEGRRQVYGSQLMSLPKTGICILRPLDDPDHVDERRAAVGLQPLAEYLKHWNIVWNLAAFKKHQAEMDVGTSAVLASPASSGETSGCSTN